MIICAPLPLSVVVAGAEAEAEKEATKTIQLLREKYEASQAEAFKAQELAKVLDEDMKEMQAELEALRSHAEQPPSPCKACQALKDTIDSQERLPFLAG